MNEKFTMARGLFSDTDTHPPEIVWALKKYIERTQMQSFVDENTIFSITSISEGNHRGDRTIYLQDIYFVEYTISGAKTFMGSKCAVHKSSIVDLIREHKLNKIL